MVLSQRYYLRAIEKPSHRYRIILAWRYTSESVLPILRFQIKLHQPVKIVPRRNVHRDGPRRTPCGRERNVHACLSAEGVCRARLGRLRGEGHRTRTTHINLLLHRRRTLQPPEYLNEVARGYIEGDYYAVMIAQRLWSCLNLRECGNRRPGRIE